MRTEGGMGEEIACSLAGEARRRTCSHAPLWSKLVATFFCTGLLKPGPGTWGSAAAVVLWFAVTRVVHGSMQPIAAIALAGIAVAIGIPAATLVARASGLKDPGFVVIDEV